MKVVLVDTNKVFLNDVQRTLLISERDDLDVITVYDLNNVFSTVGSEKPDFVVISAKLVTSMDWTMDVPIRSYASSAKELALSDEHGILCYGVIERSKQLVEAIINGYTVNQTKEQKSEKTQGEEPEVITAVQTATQQPEQNAAQNADQLPAPTVIATGQVVYDSQNNPYPLYEMTYMENGIVKRALVYYSGNTPMLYQQLDTVPQLEKKEDDFRDQVQAHQKKVEEEKRSIIEQQARAEYEKETGREYGSAKCVAVYAAKGGVGKTTLACEIATYLACTTGARGQRRRVCIVDFNIDFGDVMNTLSMDQQGPNMVTWAENIKSRLASGQQVKDIQYTRAQIEGTWLQVDKRSGLYVLCAPVSNLDSMAIDKSEIINVIINNLVKNCGFDFVICDTGNNTRDSSYISLLYADVVLMIMTQEVNTANDNKSFLRTVERVKEVDDDTDIPPFNLQKIRLILNRVFPYSAVHISTDEVEHALKDSTGRPFNFETVARIAFDTEVMKMGNHGCPMVLKKKQSHPFTKEIRKIVENLTKETPVLVPPKKNGVFQKIFHK